MIICEINYKRSQGSLKNRIGISEKGVATVNRLRNTDIERNIQCITSHFPPPRLFQIFQLIFIAVSVAVYIVEWRSIQTANVDQDTKWKPYGFSVARTYTYIRCTRQVVCYISVLTVLLYVIYYQTVLPQF